MRSLVTGPRPYWLAAARVPLNSARHYLSFTLPAYGWWTFQFLNVSYPRTVADGVQTSPELSYQLWDATGRGFQVEPIPLAMFTTPAGGPTVGATHRIGVRYKGGDAVKLCISGATGGAPAWVSLSLFGIRSWEGTGS